MLERTETEWGPWTIVEATDRRWARIKIFDTIVLRIQEALQERGLPLPEPPRRATASPDRDEFDDEFRQQPQPQAELAAQQ